MASATVSGVSDITTTLELGRRNTTYGPVQNAEESVWGDALTDAEFTRLGQHSWRTTQRF